MKPLLELIEQSGGWPVLLPDWNEKSFDWKKSVYFKNNLGYESNDFIEFSIFADNINGSHRIIHVSCKGHFTKPITFINLKLKFQKQLDRAEQALDREYMAEGLSNELVQEYFSYMVDVAVILGANQNRAEKELSEVLMFEIEMAKVSNLKLNSLSFITFIFQIPQLTYLQISSGEYLTLIGN